MTVVPAQVAGVPQHLRGVAASRCRRSSARPRCWASTHVFEMGGAQAIAAFAFGTRTVPRADRIVGPGNIYVAAAKKLLAGEVGIDFVAGPTEILIIAADGDPRHLAADMLAQAEHDVDASAVLLTTSKRLAAAVAEEVERQLADAADRGRGARSRSRSNSRHRAGAVARGGRRDLQPLRAGAPEHSRCAPARRRCSTPAACSWGRSAPRRRAITPPARITCCPPAARRAMRGGLSVADFVKVISVQELSAAGAGAAGAGHHHAGARRRPGSARPLGGGADAVASEPPKLPKGAIKPRAGGARHGAVLAAHRRAAPASCASISTRTPSAARRA